MSHFSSTTIPLIAGFFGGSASTVLLFPLDLVKVRLQVNEKSGGKGIHTRSIVHTLRGVVRHEGLVGLYQGLGPALLGSSVSWGGYFFFYEAIKGEMISRKEKDRPISSLAPFENFTAACLSGSIMVGFTNPIWLIKTRMQLQLKKAQQCQIAKLAPSSEKLKPPYKNIFDAATTIVREEGVTALYKGTVPALMLTTHGGIQFVVYEFLKKNFGEYTKATRSKNNDQSHSRSVIERLQDSMGYLTMGAVSKIIASTATYPIQLIKSRLQQRNQTAELSSTGEIEMVKREYRGVMDCVVKILKNEGFNGFFKGSLTNAIRVAPSAAITFVVYEGITDTLIE